MIADASLLGPVALSGAFWLALLQFRMHAGSERFRLRFPVGLVLGAIAAHLGWAALNWHVVREAPSVLLTPAGFCVLFVPLGLLAAAPWNAPAPHRDAFLTAAFASLPIGLAAARVGCFASGCCGPPLAIALDAAGLVALHVAAARVRADLVMPLVLAGIGAIRLVCDPLRVDPPLGAPLVPAAWLAVAWVAVAAVLCGPPQRSGGGLATSVAPANSPRRST